MQKTANLRIRIDPETKSGGLRQPRYNAETEAAIQEARDIMDGKVYAKTYYSVAEMHADIDAEDDE